MTRISLAIILFLFVAIRANAQETWSFQKCLDYAMQNSTSIEQSNLNIEDASLLYNQTKLSRLPNLNFGSSLGLNFGKTIDPVTNDFRNQNILFNSYGFTTGATLFNGGRITNSIAQDKLGMEIAGLQKDATIQSLQQSIASAYLAILLSEEQAENAKTTIALTQSTIENTQKQIDAGMLPANDILQFEAQLATDEQNLIGIQNSVELNYLSLKQLLELEPSFSMVIEKPDITNLTIIGQYDDLTVNEAFTMAMSTRPELIVLDKQVQNAQLTEKITEANLYPSVNISGNINSNYSDIAKQAVVTGSQIVESPVFIDQVPALLGSEQPTFNLEDKSFKDQIDENLGYGFSIGINVPIFNGRSAKTNLERTKLNTRNLEINNIQVKNNVKSDIQQSINNYRTAKKQYEASQKSLEAQEANFENFEKRYELGSTSTFEYINSKNNLDNARVNQSRSKYEYAFSIVLLDLILGKIPSIN